MPEQYYVPWCPAFFKNEGTQSAQDTQGAAWLESLWTKCHHIQSSIHLYSLALYIGKCTSAFPQGTNIHICDREIVSAILSVTLISALIGTRERTTMDMDTTVRGIVIEEREIVHIIQEIISIK